MSKFCPPKKRRSCPVWRVGNTIRTRFGTFSIAYWKKIHPEQFSDHRPRRK